MGCSYFHILIFCLISFIDFCKNVIFFSPQIYAATFFITIGAGATKDWQSCTMAKKHLFGTFRAQKIGKKKKMLKVKIT